MKIIATMDCFANYKHMHLSEAILYTVSTHNLRDLPFDYVSLQCIAPPTSCRTCNVDLMDPPMIEPMHTRLFSCSLTWADTEVMEDVFKLVKLLSSLQSP